MDHKVEKCCKTCLGCQLVARPDAAEPMVRNELPQGPWQDLAMDFMRPLPNGEKYFGCN